MITGISGVITLKDAKMSNYCIIYLKHIIDIILYIIYTSIKKITIRSNIGF